MRSRLYKSLVALAILAALAYGLIAIVMVPILNLPMDEALLPLGFYALLVLFLVALVAWRYLRPTPAK